MTIKPAFHDEACRFVEQLQSAILFFAVMAMWRFAIKYMTHVSGAAENSMLSIVISYAGNIFFRFTVRRTRVDRDLSQRSTRRGHAAGILVLIAWIKIARKVLRACVAGGFLHEPSVRRLRCTGRRGSDFRV